MTLTDSSSATDQLSIGTVSKSPSEDISPFGKPAFSTVSKSLSEDPGKSAASPFGGFGSSPFSTSSKKPAFGTVSTSSSEDISPFGKPAFGTVSKSSSEDISPFGKPAFGTVSKSSSEDISPFGKPAFGTVSKSSSEDISPFGKQTGPFFGSGLPAAGGSSFGSSTAYNTSIEDTQAVLKPPPGAWPGSDMFNLPSYTSPTFNDFDGPFTVKPPPGAWPGGEHMFNIASARSIDPEQLPCGYYRYEDGTTLKKYADGSMVRDFGAFRINTDPYGKSVKGGLFTTTPISNEHIPKQMGFPQPIHPNESGFRPQYGLPGLFTMQHF